MHSTSQKLQLSEKIAYGLGDCGANLIGQPQVAFLLYFYTDVLGISAGTAGTVLLLSRLFDTVNDPILGALSDRTNSRWGRYRPWILATSVPLAVALVLCYTSPNLGPNGKIVWAIATYNLLMVLYAANNIPYCALSGVMSDDSAERTSLNSWRFLCAMSAALLVTVFTVDLVDWFGRGDKALGYQATMAVWGGLAVLCFMITFAFARERIQPNAMVQTSLRRDLSDLCSSGPWIALFLLAVLINVQLAFRGGATLFYFTHYVRRTEPTWLLSPFAWFNAVGLVFAMVGVFLAKPLAERFGKRTTFQVCLLLSAILMALFAAVPRNVLWLLFALQILMQLAFGPTIPLLWTMMADVADYSEWRTGHRSTALAFASIVFGMKLGGGVGAWLSGASLGWAGYSADAESPGALRVIVMLISIFPAAALMGGVIVLFFYGIDDRVELEVAQQLGEQRRQAKILEDRTSAEANLGS